MRNLGERVAVVAVLLVLVEAGVGSGLRAQDASDRLRVDIVRAVPERLNDYIELQLDEVTPGLQAAGIPWRSVWRTAEFGNTYELHIVTPLGELAEYDTGGPLARVMEPDNYQRLIERLRRWTVSRESYAIRYHPELSVESEAAGSRYLNRVTTVEIAPGRVGYWTAFLEQRLPQFRGANIIFGVYERIFGPGPAAWQVAENHSSFTDLSQPGIIARAFGDQADAATAEIAGVVVSVERTVLRYDAELSYSSVPSR